MIFLGPALVFILVMLVIPAIRTAILSLFDRDSEEFVGLENYEAIVHRQDQLGRLELDEHVHELPFFIGVVLLIIAVARRRRR